MQLGSLSRCCQRWILYTIQEVIVVRQSGQGVSHVASEWFVRPMTWLMVVIIIIRVILLGIIRNYIVPPLLPCCTREGRSDKRRA